MTTRVGGTEDQPCRVPARSDETWSCEYDLLDLHRHDVVPSDVVLASLGPSDLPHGVTT